MKLKLLIIFFLGMAIPAPLLANPPEFKVHATTKEVRGVQVFMSARFRTPLKWAIEETLDVESHVGRYPSMKRSFCLTEEQVDLAKRKGLRNAVTIKRLFYKERCNPRELREPGKTWHFYWFQEIDYPFPLTNRWVISHVTVREMGKKKFELTSHLVYGRQSIYELRLKFAPHKEQPGQTYVEFFVWTDPGGFIPDILLKGAAKDASRRYMRAMEKGSRARAHRGDAL